MDSGMAPYTNWWGWKTTAPGSQVDPSIAGAPVIAMDNPSLDFLGGSEDDAILPRHNRWLAVPR